MRYPEELLDKPGYEDAHGLVEDTDENERSCLSKRGNQSGSESLTNGERRLPSASTFFDVNAGTIFENMRLGSAMFYPSFVMIEDNLLHCITYQHDLTRAACCDQGEDVRLRDYKPERRAYHSIPILSISTKLDMHTGQRYPQTKERSHGHPDQRANRQHLPRRTSVLKQRR